MPNVVLIDENDNVIGEMPKKEAHQKGLPHRVSVIYLLNDKGEILVQKRSDGRLDHSSAGHVDAGETYLQAAQREVEEELGVKNVELEEVGKIFNDEIEPSTGHHIRHQDTIFKVKANPVKVNKDEIQEVFWKDPKEILEDMAKDPTNLKYTNGFKIALKCLMENL